MHSSNEVGRPFSVFRKSFLGMDGTAKCVEVDLEWDRVYVGCTKGGVYVWNLTSFQPISLLKHPHWVNAVRCFPPASNVDISRSYAEAEKSKKCQESVTSSSNNIVFSTKTTYVLTACENGVLSAWTPSNYVVKSRIRPGSGPLTDIHIVSASEECELSGSNGDVQNLYRCACYIVSMRHIYIVKISYEGCMHLERNLVHEGTILCVTSLHTSQMTALLCGQDNGSISVWCLASGSCDDTLDYPPDSPELDEDTLSSSIHSPEWNDDEGIVTNTFEFNRYRSEVGKKGARVILKDHPLEALKYIYRMPSQLDAMYTKPVSTEEEFCAALSQPIKLPAKWNSLLPPNYLPMVPQGNEGEPLVFDLRRVTSLVAPRELSPVSLCPTRFYSGHGTGEVIIWDAVFAPFIVLLKKVQVLPFGSWVWHMQGLEVEVELSEEESLGLQHTSSSLLGEREEPHRTCTVLQLCVWGDNGAVRYMEASKETLAILDGPGFLSSSSFFWKKVSHFSFQVKEEPVEAAKMVKKKEHYFIIMGNFEGRVELFDLACVVSKLHKLLCVSNA